MGVLRNLSFLIYWMSVYTVQNFPDIKDGKHTILFNLTDATNSRET